jgi:hypothetical protein
MVRPLQPDGTALDGAVSVSAGGAGIRMAPLVLTVIG